MKTKQEQKKEAFKLFNETVGEALEFYGEDEASDYDETVRKASKLCRETIKAIDEEITK